ncbi:fatty acid desaturase [Geminicoccus sp.]|uniref:fatty acid desaturase n=1 Tax=Geminicoccus sp. TaxID=2024832 RepID=UPI0039C86E04
MQTDSSVPPRVERFSSQAEARYWLKVLGPFREPRLVRSVGELAITAAPFFALWLLMWFSLGYSYWLCLVLAIPAAGFLVRLFVIQHDCGHGSFFRARAANDWVGRVIGVITLTPYGHWRHTHAIHHATSGNLDKRGIGDIDTLTVREFAQLSAGKKLLYRLSRNPFILLGVAAPYLFILHYRLPAKLMWSTTEAWRSTMATNLAIVALAGSTIAVVGLHDFLMIQVPITWLASSIGVWLFFVQHQFEDGHWEKAGAWNVHTAAVHGSSHLYLPLVLRWFTANIGVHHVHHLSSRIPSYRLHEVLRAHPELNDVNRITLKDTIGCFRLALWDEDKNRLVPFFDARVK